MPPVLAPETPNVMQPVDFTTLSAVAAEVRQHWLPARCEQVVQRDATTLAMALRTLQGRGWLTLSWHPQAARLHLDIPPPKGPDTFTFSQQLKHQLNGLALGAIVPLSPWERVLDLQFSQRPGEPPQWHLYVEVMGKYSNVILVNQRQQIVTAAHQVNAQQSSLRPILTGTPYQSPPRLPGPFPSLEESLDRWQSRVALVPATVKKALLAAYGGLSSSLVQDLIHRAGLDPSQNTTTLTPQDWQSLFHQWQYWLQCLATETFAPGVTATGYSVLGATPGGEVLAPEATRLTAAPGEKLPETGGRIQTLLRDYYSGELNRQNFGRLQHQLGQTLKVRLKKLRHKRDGFRDRLDLSDQAETYRRQADLLMAYGHQWQPGLQTLTVTDFDTEKPIALTLEPDKSAIQMAQGLYKKHQKLKRSRQALDPLLTAVQQEINYLEQVEAALQQIHTYQTPGDLITLEEMRDELVQQGYLADPTYRPRPPQPGDDAQLRKFTLPSGWEVWIGRNNRQNDLIISRFATDYDLWFHTQEIPGSHVLLRLNPGASPSDRDLQQVADLAAYYSRAHQADQVPVVYTEPRHVYKPKGARPGMVIYRQERVLWGQPSQALSQPPTPAPTPKLTPI